MKYVDERFHTGDFIIGSVYERETDDGLKKSFRRILVSFLMTI